MIPATADLISRLQRSEIALPEDVRGCSPEEVEGLEAQFNIHFPMAYHRFLEIMGHGAGRLMKDVEVFVEDIVKINSAEYISDMRAFGLELPPKTFVFAAR